MDGNCVNLVIIFDGTRYSIDLELKTQDLVSFTKSSNLWSILSGFSPYKIFCDPVDAVKVLYITFPMLFHQRLCHSSDGRVVFGYRDAVLIDN